MVCPTLAIEAGAEGLVSGRRTSDEESLGALPCLGLFLVDGESVSRTAIEMVHAVPGVDSAGDARADEMNAPRCRDEVRIMMSPRRTGGCRSEGDGSAPGRQSAPTSLAGVLLAQGVACMAHVGDMRVYRFRDGKLEERTRDLAARDDVMPVEGISPDTLAMLAQRANAATRALDCEATAEVKTQLERTEPGDIFLVCSGGLWGSVPAHRIAGILAVHHELRLAASLLVDCAREHGRPEQVMCILARAGGSAIAARTCGVGA